MINSKSPILKSLKKWMEIILIFGVIFEIIIFPSLANALGCLMAILSYWIFSRFLYKKYVVLFPFAFLMYLSMYLYRYLPLVATIVESKPITYGFERPIETFFYEIILFVVSSLAFYFACRIPRNLPKNNILQNALYQIGFFRITKETIWVIGFIGFGARLLSFSYADIQYGDISGKFTEGFIYLIYAPLILLFPHLLGMENNYSKRKVWIYSAIVFIVNIASNSRQHMIAPIAIALILFFLYLVLENIKLIKFISPFKIFGILAFFLFGLNFLSDISLAILHTRAVRGDIGKMELFERTIETYKNDKVLTSLKSIKNGESEELTSYSEGWTETYIDNFMLNRYANMRISDETLYYAEKKGYDNPQMKEFMVSSLISLLPTPVLGLFGIKLDKSEFEFSRGDILYGKGFGGYRVTSHVADGLATFGFLYFPLQFFIFFLIFKLLNCFIFHTSRGIYYAPYALISVFTFIGFFRNANGILMDISYILRGYWQGILTFMISLFLANLISKIFFTRFNRNSMIFQNEK